VSSTGASDDKAGPETKCKDFDGLSSADLAFWDVVLLESPGGGGRMAPNRASSAIERGTDGDAAALNRETHKKVKVEKNVAYEKAECDSLAVIIQGMGLFQACGGGP